MAKKQQKTSKAIQKHRNSELKTRSGKAKKGGLIVSRRKRSVSPRDNAKVNSPLKPDEFVEVLKTIDSLGLTWTADLPVLLRPKSEEAEEAILSKEFKEIQDTYPDFPHELTHVIYTTLTGRDYRPTIVGPTKDFEAKSRAVSETVVSPEFISEFFFKHALKVPYFSKLDWEVVVKAFENNVQGMPLNAYAIVSVLLRSAVHESKKSSTFTFALDEQAVRSLMKSLASIEKALQAADQVRKKVPMQIADGKRGDVKQNTRKRN